MAAYWWDDVPHGKRGRFHRSAVTPDIAVPPAPQTALQRETAIPVGAVKEAPQTDTAPPILHGDEWQSPIPVLGSLNTAGAEDAPFITPDGNTLFFFFTPDLSVPPEKQLLDGVTGIYTSRFQNGGWGQVERVLLQAPRKLALDGCPFAQAGTMWFCSTR